VKSRREKAKIIAADMCVSQQWKAGEKRKQQKAFSLIAHGGSALRGASQLSVMSCLFADHEGSCRKINFVHTRKKAACF
jgi:hypothetical protein